MVKYVAGQKFLSVVLAIAAAACTLGGCGEDPVDPNSEPRFGIHNVQPGEQLSIPGYDLLMRDITYFAGNPIVLFEVVGTDQIVGPFLEESLSYTSMENLQGSRIGRSKSYGGLHVDIRSVVDNEVEVEIQPYERATFESISFDCIEFVFEVGDQVVVPGGVVHVKSVNYTGQYIFLWYDFGNGEYDYEGFPQGYGVPNWFVEGVSFGVVTTEGRSVTFSALCLLK